ncbi:urease accessory protein UreG [Blastococcus aggregatus]|nr:urease accessory protein UreG [Blastococcus aggregatus]
MGIGTASHHHGSSHSHGTSTGHPACSSPETEPPARPLRIGIAGPIGSGKTTLMIELVRRLAADGIACGVVTNDVYTTVDADIVTRSGVLPTERIVGVATGGCPHAAIRDDVSVNDAAVTGLVAREPGLDVVFIESGGDNLTATFSRELVHRWICVIDVGAGDKIPSKGGPGITESDLVVVNKSDIADQVGASVAIFRRDLDAARGELPYAVTSTRDDASMASVAGLVGAWATVG